MPGRALAGGCEREEPSTPGISVLKQMLGEHSGCRLRCAGSALPVQGDHVPILPSLSPGAQAQRCWDSVWPPHCLCRGGGPSVTGARVPAPLAVGCRSSFHPWIRSLAPLVLSLVLHVFSAFRLSPPGPTPLWPALAMKDEHTGRGDWPGERQ